MKFDWTDTPKFVGMVAVTTQGPRALGASDIVHFDEYSLWPYAKPIPPTPAILEALGFGHSFHCGWIGSTTWGIHLSDIDHWFIVFEHEEDHNIFANTDRKWGREIPYIHDLQREFYNETRQFLPIDLEAITKAMEGGDERLLRERNG